MAPLALTIEADERVGSKGDVVTKLDEAKLREDLRVLGVRPVHAGRPVTEKRPRQ